MASAIFPRKIPGIFLSDPVYKHDLRCGSLTQKQRLFFNQEYLIAVIVLLTVTINLIRHSLVEVYAVTIKFTCYLSIGDSGDMPLVKRKVR